MTTLPDHHVVFIGRPNAPKPVDPETIGETSIFAPRHHHDRSNFPNRHDVALEIVEHVAGPGQRELELRSMFLPSGNDDAGEPQYGTIAIATGHDAFRCLDLTRDSAAFDRAYAERVNAMLSEAFVVMHAYPIYVDFGNSACDPFREFWGCLGMGPSCKSAGFGTLEEARAYARSLT